MTRKRHEERRSGKRAGKKLRPEERFESRAPVETGLGTYLKEAFFFRWNLLGLVGSVAAALLSPIPGALLPLVGAVELAYLAGLVSIPKFRSAIDGKHHAARRDEVASETEATREDALRSLLGRLSRDARQRFDALRERCIQMQAIAHGVSARTERSTPGELARPGLDRLLWAFLRLLASQDALTRFLETTDEARIQTQIDEKRETLARFETKGNERMIRSLRDSLATAEMRLENYGKAEQNAHFVAVELDRLEGKIRTLSEMAVNRQDPDFISREVDSVAESITQTEAAMSELQLMTGLMESLDEPPVILSNDLEGFEHES